MKAIAILMEMEKRMGRGTLKIAETNLSKAEGTKELVEAKLALRRARIRIEAVDRIRS
jgi:hypothetical protein